MAKKKKPNEIDELEKESEVTIEDIFGDDEKDEGMSEDEYRARQHEPPPEDEERKDARVKIAQEIINPHDDRVCELTWLPKGLFIPICLKETVNYMTHVLTPEELAILKNRGIRRPRASEYLISRIDKRLRGVGGRLIERATMLAGDEARAKEDEEREIDGV